MSKTFHALQVEDIKREDYLIWVAKYNVQDVSPPPPRFITASQSKILTTSEVTKFEELSHRLSIKDGSVEIPDGYFPQEANVNLSWAGGTHGNMWFQVQGRQVYARLIWMIKVQKPFHCRWVFAHHQCRILLIQITCTSM